MGSSILKEHLIKGYSLSPDRALITNENYINLLNDVNNLKRDVSNLKEIVDKKISNSIIIYEGNCYDVFSFFNGLIKEANESVIIVDGNEMSVNEYKEWFKNKIKDNPRYDYFEENMSKPVAHKCPVCGEYEFSDELSSDICPVCGWEDTGFENMPEEKPNKYMMSFNEKLQWFKEQRKINLKYKWSKDKK